MSIDGSKFSDIITSYDILVKKLAPYKPDVKKLQFDYLNKTSILKLRITVPEGLKRNIRNIEIPASGNYKITEITDSMFNTVNSVPQLIDSKWIIKAKDLPKSEYFLVTMESKVSEEIIKKLVRIDAPEDPNRTDETDEYWVHSAIRDIALLESVYQELNIDNVQTSVKVGIERTFASSTPPEISEYLQAKAEADRALSLRDREDLFRKWRTLKGSTKKIGTLQPYEIFQIIQKLITPTKFKIFVHINDPFRVHSVSASNIGIPESVKVNVLTELNTKLPAAKGNLVFRKREFSDNVKKEFEDLMDKTKKKPKK